jgi:hypothetical protein
MNHSFEGNRELTPVENNFSPEKAIEAGNLLIHHSPPLQSLYSMNAKIINLKKTICQTQVQ